MKKLILCILIAVLLLAPTLGCNSSLRQKKTPDDLVTERLDMLQKQLDDVMGDMTVLREGMQRFETHVADVFKKIIKRVTDLEDGMMQLKGVAPSEKPQISPKQESEQLDKLPDDMAEAFKKLTARKTK